MSSEQSPDATRWQDTRFIGRKVTSSRTVVANSSGFSPPRARKAASEDTQSTATTADSDTAEDVLGTCLASRSPSTPEQARQLPFGALRSRSDGKSSIFAPRLRDESTKVF